MASIQNSNKFGIWLNARAWTKSLCQYFLASIKNTERSETEQSWDSFSLVQKEFASDEQNIIEKLVHILIRKNFKVVLRVKCPS